MLCYVKLYTLKIIHLFNLTKTFYDIFRHIYMSPDSHMKILSLPPLSPSDGLVCLFGWWAQIWREWSITRPVSGNNILHIYGVRTLSVVDLSTVLIWGGKWEINPHPVTVPGVSFKFSSSRLFGRQTKLTVWDSVTGWASSKSAKSWKPVKFPVDPANCSPSASGYVGC